MKNKFFTLLVATMIVGSMFAGCGGNEVGTEKDANVGSSVSTSTETNVETEVSVSTDEEVNSDNETSEIKYGVSNPDATYTELEYCYIVSEASFVEEKYNDGTEFDRTNWTLVNEIIKLNVPISIYNPFKDIMGYMKTDVIVVYVSEDGEWSYLGFAKEVEKDGLYPNGGTYVRTDELKVAMAEVTLEEEQAERKEMSDEAKEIFARFKEKVDENNVTREEVKNQYPNMEIVPLVETDSPDGLEYFGTFYCSLDDESGLEGLLVAFITQDYNMYYIEYVGESNLGVEINIYGAK